jgi:hypothetical protein
MGHKYMHQIVFQFCDWAVRSLFVRFRLANVLSVLDLPLQIDQLVSSKFSYLGSRIYILA